MATGAIKENKSVATAGTYTKQFPCFGYVTSSGTLAVLNLIMEENIRGFTVSNIQVTDSSQIRIGTGGYVSGISESYLTDNQNHGNTLFLGFTKPGGWGVTNNILIGGVITIKYTLS